MPSPSSVAACFGVEILGLAFREGEETVEIEVCRDGTWDHPKWGRIEINPTVRQSFVDNFAANVRLCGDLPLDYDHEPGPASGWIKGLRNEGPSLKASVAFTPRARDLIERGEYRFFSPEWHPNFVNPTTKREHGPTLFGGGLTNRPFFRELAPLPCSEDRPPGTAGNDPGAMPRKDARMSDEVETITAAEATQMRERMQLIERENATLRAAEDRRTLAQTFSEMRFDEGGGRVLAPASRTALVDALLPLPQAQRDAVTAAVKSLQFAQLGEVGFVAAEPRKKDEPTEAEIKELAAMTPAGLVASAK